VTAPSHSYTDLVQGVYDAARNAIVGTLDLRSYGRKITTITLNGPANSTLRVYRGRVISDLFLVNTVYPAGVRFYDTTTEGAPLRIQPGEVYTWVWTGGAVAAGVTAAATVNSEVF
jgi:hypothetical protein